MSRNNLIICRASERSMHYAWLDGDPVNRNWDLWLSPYRPILPAYNHDVLIDQVSEGNKFAALHKLLTNSSLWRGYQNVMLADEDIFAMPGTWSRFFDRVNAIGDLSMASPALTENSVYSHPIVVQRQRVAYRRTSFIEGMMPCFRSGILDRLLSTFTADPTGSGWGIDYVWAKWLNYKGIYVIDETPVTHWRPNVHDRSYWPEAHAVLDRFQVTDRIEHTYEIFPE